MWKVPLSAIDMGAAEEEAVLAVLRRRWISMGPETEAFEAAFAAQMGVAHAVAVSSGTAALHLALLTAGVGPGDEVVLPALTFVATAHAVLYCGAQPVLADVESESRLLLDPRDTERRCSPRTRAIVPVHYAGAPCDMVALRGIAAEGGLALVEDAAHAAGVAGVGRGLSTACFSFYANKNLVSGEGGMITTNDADRAALLRRLRSHGMSTSAYDRSRGKESDYDVTAHGFNYRITEMQAALGRVQLRRLVTGNRRRSEIAQHYRERLVGLDLTFPFEAPPCHLMVVLLPTHAERTRVRAVLAAAGIQTSVHYPPIHRLSAFAHLGAGPLPVTDALAPRLLTLPLHARLSEADVEHVCNELDYALEEARC